MYICKSELSESVLGRIVSRLSRALFWIKLSAKYINVNACMREREQWKKVWRVRKCSWK